MTCGVIGVLFAGAALLAPFRPGEVTVGGEIGRRMSVTRDKMLRHTDIEGTFTRHFRHRKAKPDEPGGFAGYGMFLDALVTAAAHGIGGAETVCAKTRLLAELGGLQTPDGRITMFSGASGFWDNHEGAYLIQALCRDHRWFGTAASLETARRLADALIADTRSRWATARRATTTSISGTSTWPRRLPGTPRSGRWRRRSGTATGGGNAAACRLSAILPTSTTGRRRPRPDILRPRRLPLIPKHSRCGLFVAHTPKIPNML